MYKKTISPAFKKVYIFKTFQIVVAQTKAPQNMYLNGGEDDVRKNASLMMQSYTETTTPPKNKKVQQKILNVNYDKSWCWN